jgi:hypothetical protein
MNLRALVLYSAAAGMLYSQAVGANGQPKLPLMPRTAEGKPDLTGVWQGGSTRPGTWEEANAGPGPDGRPSVAGAPAATGPATAAAIPRPEPAPYQEWAKARVQESFDRRAIDDPTARCLMGGVPRSTTVGLFPMQIAQTPTQVIILYEYFHEYRVIPLNAKHPDDLEPSYMGDSVGHWEGDTLVVDVTGFNDRTWIGPVGSFHTEAMHVTERYTRVDRDRINYEAIVEDPNVLTKPWTLRSSIMLRSGTRLREYECVENNTDIQHYEELLKNESLFRRK